MKSLLAVLLFIPSLCFAQFTQSWVKTYNGVGDYTDHFTCLATDGAGNIYAGGYTHTTDENADFLICAFNASGNLLWKKSWRGSGQGPDRDGHKGPAKARKRVGKQQINARYCY